MKISYVDILGDRRRHTVTAEVTTDHPASSYGIPVVVLPDGEALSIQSWILLGYQVKEATPDELAALRRALAPYTEPAVSARALRAIPSERRAQASRENGKKGGRPRKKPVE
jgi:hypothetical protein